MPSGYACDECDCSYDEPGNCPSCGNELFYWEMSENDYNEIHAHREAWEKANLEAMAECDGSWDI